MPIENPDELVKQINDLLKDAKKRDLCDIPIIVPPDPSLIGCEPTENGEIRKKEKEAERDKIIADMNASMNAALNSAFDFFGDGNGGGNGSGASGLNSPNAISAACGEKAKQILQAKGDELSAISNKAMQYGRELDRLMLNSYAHFQLVCYYGFYYLYRKSGGVTQIANLNPAPTNTGAEFNIAQNSASIIPLRTAISVGETFDTLKTSLDKVDFTTQQPIGTQGTAITNTLIHRYNKLMDFGNVLQQQEWIGREFNEINDLETTYNQAVAAADADYLQKLSQITADYTSVFPAGIRPDITTISLANVSYAQAAAIEVKNGTTAGAANTAASNAVNAVTGAINAVSTAVTGLLNNATGNNTSPPIIAPIPPVTQQEIQDQSKKFSDAYYKFATDLDGINKGYAEVINKKNEDFFTALKLQLMTMFKNLSQGIMFNDVPNVQIAVGQTTQNGIFQPIAGGLQYTTPTYDGTDNFIFNFNQRTIDVVQNPFFAQYDRIIVNLQLLCFKMARFKEYNLVDDNFFPGLEKAITDFNINYPKVIFYFDFSNPKVLAEKFKNDIVDVEICGKKIFKDAKSDPNSVQVVDNNDARSYPANADDSNILKVKYWLRYGAILTLQNLIPMYWTIGLLVPNPSGVTRVPLPTVWLGLAVFDTPTHIYVVFLTINGMVVFPVLWELEKNANNAASTLKIMFRGGNQKIKDKTGCESANIPKVAGIDVNPPLSKSLPLTKDDLPIMERLNITNPLLLLYLDKWLTTAKNYMGFP